MIRVSLSLGRITPQISAKFSIVYESDASDGQAKKKKEKALTVFNLGGKNISFSANPYITLKFTDRKLRDKNIDTGRYDTSYDASKAPTLNRQSTYQLIMLLKRFHANVIKYEEKCFCYIGENMVLTDLAKRGDFTITETLKNGKTFIITPAVIVEGNDGNSQYQGCTMACNSLDNYVEFTFDELEYFIYQLSSVDFNQLCLSLTMYGKMLEKVPFDDGSIDEIHEALSQNITISKVPDEEIKRIENAQVAKKEYMPPQMKTANSLDAMSEFDF